MELGCYTVLSGGAPAWVDTGEERALRPRGRGVHGALGEAEGGQGEERYEQGRES